ncbi:DEAD-like helicase [Enterocloster bolteae 90B3]|nr:DEAD-like helicase [Enterocloster bolteae 90B3]
MPTKAELYAQMADKVATQLTGSWQEWAGFLTTASRLYKYPFHEQLMIYAQRPDATACAEYDLWNEKMGRYVRRGSKGIALVDDSGDRPRLRYVFDISDTGTREHSRTPWLWKMEEAYQEPVSAMLEHTYEVGGDNLAQQLEAVAHKLAGEYWNEHRQDLLYIVDDSFLEEYDEFNIEAQFKAAATVSISYALMSRCGLEPERYFTHEDFMAIFDFNTPATIGALGTAVSQINQQVLRQIGVTIRNYGREQLAERSKHHEESHELHPERRLPDSRPEAERAAGEAPGQVRQDAEIIPEGTPSHPLQPAADEREAVPTPAGNRRDRTDPSGAADAPAGGGSGRDGAAESQRPHEVGGSDEHLQGPGRGNPDGGAYSQLSFFLSENEQIRIIDEAENVKASSAFSFAQADIDHVLRLGGNTDRQRERVVAAFEKQKTTAEFADILKNLYHGGNGIGSVTAWYAEDGIHLSHGKTARYDKSAQVISWESAAERIGQLLQDGQFAANVELTEAAGYERSLLAEKFWNLYHDFSEEAREAGYLPSLAGNPSRGFPEESAWLAEQLNRPEFRQTLAEEYAAFWTAYQQDRELLRFHYHKPREIWENLKDLSLPRTAFTSQLMEVPAVKQFITEDEIDAAMTRGSGFESGKGRIFTFFQNPHTDKEKVDFLKNEYGTGGHSHALSGAGGSWEDHDGKGLHYKKDGCPDVHFTWKKVAKRITDLIQKGRYLTEQEQAEYDKIQEEKALAEEDAMQTRQPDTESAEVLREDMPEQPIPTIQALHEQYKPIVLAAVMEDVPYRNACGHSDRENAVIEGNAAIRRAILGSSDLELIRLYSDVLVFRQRLHREIIDETYPRLHEMLRPLSQDDIDDAIRAWNGDIQSKHAVVRYMEKHGREKDTAAWLAQEYSGSDSKSLFVIRAGSPEGIELPWPKVQRRIAQLIKEDRFYTEAEQDRFDNIDPIAIREALAERGIVNGELVDEEKLDNDPFIQRVMADVEQIAAEEQEQSNQPLSDAEYARHNLIPGETTFALDGRTFRVSKLEPDVGRVELQDVTFANAVGFPIFRVEPISVIRQHLEQEPEPPTPATEPEKTLDEVLDEHPVSIQVNGEWQTFPNVKAAEEASYEEYKANLRRTAENFRITDDHLGEGGPKAKFQANVEAIKLLKYLEETTEQATPEQQKILSRYVGWGGLADAFDPDKESWSKEYAQLKELLTPEEYAAARGSTLNAHYTSPTVIKAIYEAVGRMGFETGNILEPSCGVGNFFGMLPEEMRNSRLYGVELDSISGRIAQQLYPKADITVAGFETTDRRDFYDLAVGNVPFGQYQVRDKAYDKLNFSIHNYFFAKALDQVRPGGVVAFVTSRYTMDAKDSTVRRYLAQRAELLGAIRLPNDAFKKNAGAEVVSDIIFLQKRDRPLDIVPEWTQTGQTEDGFAINRYFLDHPEMVLGRQEPESTAHGMDYTVNPIEGLELADQLHDAVKYIRGTYQEADLPELGEGETIDTSIPADPNVKNYSYTVVDGDVYYRENSCMVRPDLNATAEARVKGLVGLRECVQQLIDLEMDASTPDSAIRDKQAELNRLYDSFSAKYGLINDRANRLAFADDSSYYLLCALEVIDEDGKLERKADMFTKRTIKPHKAVETVDTASEALAVSIAERACVDMAYMSELTGKTVDELAAELQGVIFRVPGQVEKDGTPHYVTADEYLSGNVRRKLRQAQRAAQQDPSFAANVEALTAAQPKDLDASEIEVRLGATWIDKAYIQQFMYETFDTPFYMQRNIEVNYTPFTAQWQITGKNSVGSNNVAAYTTYGTSRANAYKILEDSLNLRDVRIYDTVEDADGRERRVLNAKETTLAAQKQQAIRDAFRDWIWKDPERRQTLVRQYNEEMNSTRPREYDGSHITFGGMNPSITLREHQLGAIAHVLYGGNTLLAHEVGAGKTFEMVAAAMESKRLGLCQKSLFVVPNHLTEQWASEFLRLYPSANILVTTKKDFETHNRKKFCARIATGDYDAIIMGHSQFEKIPISRERQERLLNEQIDEITEGIAEVEASGGERFTVKQLERTRKSLEARLEKLQAESRKDDVVTFEQLGVDRLFVDEAHNYKNLFLYTKMRNVAGLSTSDAQKSSDMFAKCRYMDEITGNRGVIFATGTPVSNSMTELYTMQRYLQYDRLQELNMTHFDCWASRFGETVTALELAPEGTGYRARTRFSKFFNLPELMNLFKEVADIKTADQLNLPTPEVEYHNIVAQPTEHQQEMVKALSERASEVHRGSVDPSVDNMLKITSDGRKLGLDQRIINQLLPDEPGTKVNQCVDNIMQIWRDGDADKLTQLVFCDISTPQAAPSKKAAKQLDNPLLHGLEEAIPLDEPEPAFTIYEDIRQKLIAQGMPAEQIAFIHEAKTEVQKKELFSKVRTGQVRVLLGSTSKMGAGTNVQDRLVALHDLDCPWRPGDLAQRKGRIERQGNQNPLVHVYRYVTEGTFDAYLWQTVENKQKFISQIMTSKSPVRSCDDVDETALSFAEIKALCAGDPRIKERMDLDVEVARLKLMKADHRSKQYRLEDQLLKYFPQEIETNKGYIQGFEADLETLAAHPHPADGFAGMEIRGDVLTDKENAGAALLDACKEVKTSDPVQIGSYRGFTMSVEFQAWKQEYTLLLKGQMTHRATLGTDPRGNLTRIDNALAQMPQRLEAVKNQLENLYQQQAAAKEEVGKPFPFEDDLRVKSARLVELDTLLNIDGKGHAQPETVVAKSARPSVLDSLKRPVPPRSPEKKPKQHEEVR